MPPSINNKSIGVTKSKYLFIPNTNESKSELEESGKFDKPIVTAISKAPVFYIAEEYHQDFYQKQNARYQLYARASGRKGFLEDTWGDS